MFKKVKYLLFLLINYCIILLGLYQKINIKIIILCLFINNILIIGIYLFYKIKDIGG